jgi:glycine/serine hydroxymethyltransferase
MKEAEMELIADMIDSVLRDPGNERIHATTIDQVKSLCMRFPFYGRIYSL